MSTDTATPLSATELDEIEEHAKDSVFPPSVIRRLVEMARRVLALDGLTYFTCCKTGYSERHCIGCRRNEGSQPLHDDDCPLVALAASLREVSNER